MTRIVERCSTCGLEHDEPTGECEACHGALRFWCRAHSRELGWLESAECRQCAEEKARPRPVPAPRPAPRREPPRRTAPPLPAPVPATARPLRADIPGPGTEGHAAARPRDWAYDHKRVAVFTVLRTWMICVILFTVFGAVQVAENGGGLGGFVTAGWVLGLLLGAVIALIRLYG